MITPKRTAIVVLASLCCLSAPHLYAADSTIEADKTFVAKVSQGGMYEVQASKLAEKLATAPDVKDLATTEVHDHEGVNKNLKALADAAGIEISKDLNDEFKKRLEKLSTVSPADFDAAYLKDMKQIHDKDEKLFAKEAQEGSDPFKTFARQTDQIVKRHIGALHAAD